MTYQITFGTYTLPMPQNISDNFMNFVPSTDRIHGMDGGFDNYGPETAPREIGNVSVSFIVSTYDDTLLQGLLDELGKLAAYGKQELRKWPHGAASTAYRYCVAKFNNVSIGEDLAGPFERYKRVITVSFQVDDPMWYARAANAAEWAYTNGPDNLVWNTGGSLVWDGLQVNAIAITNYVTTQAFGYTGTARTPLQLTITTSAGQTLYNPRILLEFDGRVWYEARWQGVLSATESLVIDSVRRQLILLSSTRAPDQEYGNFWVNSADWLMVRPTVSQVGTIRIYTERSTDRGSVLMNWRTAYST